MYVVGIIVSFTLNQIYVQNRIHIYLSGVSKMCKEKINGTRDMEIMTPYFAEYQDGIPIDCPDLFSVCNCVLLLRLRS